MATLQMIQPRDWAQHAKTLTPAYKSTVLRAPKQQLLRIPPGKPELHNPVFGHAPINPLDHDLTKSAVRNGEPLGERIVVTGRVLDEDGRPVKNTLVELWQCNAAGRYVHPADQHPAPLDPNFLGAGRTLTDNKGRYKFYTIKPGAYPWGNHHNAWRPAHLHFSLFGDYFASRLITQMYFPNDPLFAFDPIYQSAPIHARDGMVSKFDMSLTEPEFALAYVFDIVLRGPKASRFE